MTQPATVYSLRRVQHSLGLTRAAVVALVDAGFVVPQRGPRNALLFSFQDLMLLRTAHGLRAAKVPTRRIVAALSSLRASLPAALPLTGLRISAVDSAVVVRDRQGPREVETGQWLIDFEVAPDGDSVVLIRAADRSDTAANDGDAGAWFRRGEAAEGMGSDAGSETVGSAGGNTGSDPSSAGATGSAGAAEAAYRRAIELDPLHAEAVLNLGALWCETGRAGEAISLYKQALQGGSASALLHFNLAVALEDQSQPAEALASYEQALALDPALADAHYNAGRLHEQMGQHRTALRHFSAYKRLQRQPGA